MIKSSTLDSKTDRQSATNNNHQSSTSPQYPSRDGLVAPKRPSAGGPALHTFRVRASGLDEGGIVKVQPWSQPRPGRNH